MRNRWLAIAAAALIAGCSSSAPDTKTGAATATTTPSVKGGSYSPDETPFPVGAIPNATIHDSQRNRDFEAVIEYPTRTGGPYPVIIFSHGYGASKDSYTPLTEFWAGHGYVCIKPNHADAGALRQILAERRAQRQAEMEKQRAENGGRTPRRNQQQARPEEPIGETIWQSQSDADWRNRARDIVAVIDSLDRIEERYPELKGKMDHARIGVAGHSYGAFTAMEVAGTKLFRGSETIHLRDPRVKAMVALSPQGVGAERGLTTTSWAELNIPALFMTGSLDRGAGGNGDPGWRHDPFAFSPAGDKYFVSLEGARHSSFAGGVLGDIADNELPDRGMMRPQTDPWGNPAGTSTQTMPRNGRGDNFMGRERGIFDAVKVGTTVFWDAYLKDDPSAKDYLKGDRLGYLNNGKVTVERK
jgi:predicted dienelactone hydrolase